MPISKLIHVVLEAVGEVGFLCSGKTLPNENAPVLSSLYYFEMPR